MEADREGFPEGTEVSAELGSGLKVMRGLERESGTSTGNTL